MIQKLKEYIEKIKNHNIDLEPCCLNLLDEIIFGLNELIDGEEESSNT